MKATELPEIINDFVPRSTLAQEGWARTAGYLAAGQVVGLAGQRLRQRRGLSAGLGTFLKLGGQMLTGLGVLSGLFYRDPERDPVASDPNFFYAPADGKIVEIAWQVDEPKFIAGPAHKITIASNLLDVHIHRSPVPGLVRYVFYDTSEQHRANYLGIALYGDDSKGRVLVVQQNNPKSLLHLPAPLADLTPGSLRVWAGSKVELAQKIGLAGFGQATLVSLYVSSQLPIDILCQEGQRIQAGMTVLGRFKQA